MAKIEFLNGASFVFDVALLNDDETPLPHNQFLDVIVYVYVVESKTIKFSISDKYTRLSVIDANTVQVKCTPEMTKAIGSGMARYSLYVSVATGSGTKDVCLGEGNLLPFKHNPISNES